MPGGVTSGWDQESQVRGHVLFSRFNREYSQKPIYLSMEISTKKPNNTAIRFAMILPYGPFSPL